jgi:SAM-dependent methyltransferase
MPTGRVRGVSEAGKRSNFDAYTRCYDLLYRDKDYAAEAAYIAAQLCRRAPQAQRILELGCGTGGHAVELARLGFTVHGVDLSDSMLARAEERRNALAPELAQRASFASGDARSVRVQGEHPFDAVISLFHVMSYQTSNADLAAAYATASAHLAPGGVFLFDHWHGPAVLTQQPGTRVRRLADEHIRVTRLAEPVMHWQRNVCDVNYSLFVEELGPDSSHALHQFQETHPMRYLFAPELALLEGSNWRDAEHLAWMGEAAPDDKSWAALRVLSKT